MKFVIDQLVLALFNYLNSQLDAYKIMQNKTVAHAVNFGAYAALTAALIYLSHPPFWVAFVFCASAFFNRQIFFDIPLNLTRNLPWYYQSTATPPQALMDKIERIVFPSNNGKLITGVYASFWVLTVIIYFVWLN